MLGRVRSALVMASLTVGLATSAPALAATPTPVPTSANTTTSPLTVGVISVTPTTGNDLVPLSLITSKACPSGVRLIGRILGPGLPDIGINVVPNTSAALFPRTAAGGYFMPSNNTLRTLLDQLPDPPTLKGTYQLRVLCVGPVSPVILAQFTGSMVFDGHHAYVAHEPNVPKASLATVPVVPGPPLPTAVGSEAPERAQSPAVVKAAPAAATTAKSKSGWTSGRALWLISIGAIVVAFGLSTLIRERRTRKAKGAEK